MQEEAADAKVKGLAKKVKNAEAALQRARDDLAQLMELCVPSPPALSDPFNSVTRLPGARHIGAPARCP